MIATHPQHPGRTAQRLRWWWWWWRWWGLVESAAAQVVGDDDVGDGVEHELYVVGVGGARHVAVYLLRRRLVLRLELRLDVGGRLAVLLGAWTVLTSVNLQFIILIHYRNIIFSYISEASRGASVTVNATF